LEGESATRQRCRLCCRLLEPLPALNSAAKIREFYRKRRYRSSIMNPKSVADSLPAHLPARKSLSHVFPSCTYASVFPVSEMFFLSCLHRSSSVVARSTTGGIDESRMSCSRLVFMVSHLPVCRGLFRSTTGGIDESRMSCACLVFMVSHLPVCREV